jgi:hypothetical protein
MDKAGDLGRGPRQGLICRLTDCCGFFFSDTCLLALEEAGRYCQQADTTQPGTDSFCFHRLGFNSTKDIHLINIPGMCAYLFYENGCGKK